MLRPVLLALFCCTTFTEQTGRDTRNHISDLRLEYPKALSYSDAAAFCKKFGLRLREPRVEYLEDVLSQHGPHEKSVSFFLPERYLSGSLCSILQTYARNGTINSFKAFGSCNMKRCFACGPLLRFTYDASPGQGPGSEATESEVTEAGSTAAKQDVTSDVSSATETGAPDDRNDTKGAEWSGIRTATIVFAPINALLLSICLWAFCCTEFLKNVRTTLQLHLCALLFFGQLSLVISSCQCSAAVGAQLQFVYLGAVIFSTLEGILLMHASFTEEAPSMSLFYVVIGYSFSLVLAAAGFAKLGDNYRQFEQLCVLSIETGAGWLMLGPVIAMILINVTSVFVYEFRISYLSETATTFPSHLEARGRLIRSLGLTTFFLGLQWIFGSIVQQNTDAFSVLFFLFNSATSIAILVNHVACDREIRASMARVLGNRGKTARRLADILRPAPRKVDGLNQRVTYHTPPKVSDTLRSTLDRGIRPSIHLIRPLDHVPVST